MTRRRPSLGLFLLLGIWAVGAAPAAHAQTLSADLSSHVIGITTGFVGANLVLFGATDREGDIVVIVRGPPSEAVVRRKEKMLGVWINGSSAVFHEAPSFYRLAATRALAQIATPETLERYDIGLGNIRLQPSEALPEPDLAIFRAAFIANQEKLELYRGDPGRVIFLGEELFRADIAFPANVPTGNYSVEVILFSGGEVISAQTTPLVVSRIGFSNNVFVAAHHHAALYGAGALAFALAAGFGAAAIFRKV